MIPSSAALAGAFWERLRVLPSEQRRAAGREPPSEQPSEGQPGYLGESLVHHLRHPAPISATQPTDIPATDIQAMRSRATETQAPRDTSPTPVLRAMDTQATQDSPPTPPRVTDRQATRDTPAPDPRPPRHQATQDGQLTQVVRAIDIRARRPILLIPVTEIRSLAIPAIALLRRAEYAIEPAS
jgi:hypothetical protein